MSQKATDCLIHWELVHPLIYLVFLWQLDSSEALEKYVKTELQLYLVICQLRSELMMCWNNLNSGSSMQDSLPSCMLIKRTSRENHHQVIFFQYRNSRVWGLSAEQAVNTNLCAIHIAVYTWPVHATYTCSVHTWILFLFHIYSVACIILYYRSSLRGKQKQVSPGGRETLLCCFLLPAICSRIGALQVLGALLSWG